MRQKTESFRFLWPYLYRYRWQFVPGLAALVLNNSIWLAMPLVLKAAIDSLTQSMTREKLMYYALAVFGLALAKGFFQYWMRWILIGISRDIEYDLRNDLFRHLARLSPSFYSRTRTGDIMARATNDLNAARMLLGPGIMYSANTVMVMTLSLTVLLRMDWRLTLAAFVPVPAVSLAVVYFGRLIHDRFERIQAMFSDLSARVQENIAGMRVVKAYAQEEAEMSLFRTANQAFVARNVELIRVFGGFYPLLQVLIGLSFVVVLWMGGREVVSGHLSVGAFVAFNAYMVQLTWPMIALGWVVNIAERGIASTGRIRQLMEEPPDITSPQPSRGFGAPGNDEMPAGTVWSAGVPPAPGYLAESRTPGAGQRPALHTFSVDGCGSAVKAFRGEIEFRDLSFAYNGAPVLKNISLRIAAGQTLAIVGQTGSGKSSLVSLIPRMFNAPPGTLFVDGVDVREWDVEVLRRQIGFVPQETFLFSATLRDNIAFGVEQAGEEQIRWAAAVAGILSDVESFPAGFGTIIGERGITLSGGQKQRTAIARAVLRDPRILILDDALSSVDTYTEERILNELRKVMAHRTSILISHRVSTVRGADLIVVLNNGEIVERGTHDELIALGGYYAELYQKQLLEEELERA